MSITTDRNDPGLKETDESGMQKSYLVLSEQERAKGFVRPYRDSYVHLKCGVVTKMNREIAETYARNPSFYGATYCCASSCKTHFPLIERDETGKSKRMFLWDDADLRYGNLQSGIPTSGNGVGE